MFYSKSFYIYTTLWKQISALIIKIFLNYAITLFIYLLHYKAKTDPVYKKNPLYIRRFVRHIFGLIQKYFRFHNEIFILPIYLLHLNGIYPTSVKIIFYRKIVSLIYLLHFGGVSQGYIKLTKKFFYIIGH